MTVETQHIGPDATGALVRFVQAQGLNRFSLVADERTWAALGQAVAAALRAVGADIQTIVLPGDEVVADGERIVEVLLPGDQNDRTFLAVGAGVITDLTRFVSHCLSRPFISLPTAPSADAYTSANAPLVVRRFKQTFKAQEPIAVFADLDVLCAAPPAMIAAGVGDILGKYTALADWRLGALLWDEAIDESVVEAMYAALQSVANQVESIGRREPTAIASLMQALLDSGSAMARWINSRPASGSEHHISHYWEMKLLQQGRPAILHGAKVGVATVMMARAYERLRSLERDQVAVMLDRNPQYGAQEILTRIRAGYGDLADMVIAQHRDIFSALSAAWADFRVRLPERWDQVRAIAAQVPPPNEISAQLQAAHAPTTPAALGFSTLEADDALRYAHFIRGRPTVRWVERALGLP